MNTVAELRNVMDLQFNKEYFSQKPALLKDSIKDTHYFKTWSYEYLKAKIGSRSVNVRYIENGIFDQYSELRPMNFDDFIDLASSLQSTSRSYYLQATDIHTTFPELLDELIRPPLMRESDVSSSPPLLWIGAAGCVSPLHYDYDDNFLVQVKGKKLITLFAPSDTPYLYPNVQPPLHLSSMNLEVLDLRSFPLFPKASPIECVLCEGDVLYIPPKWWHHVKTKEASISINYWFKRPVD